MRPHHAAPGQKTFLKMLLLYINRKAANIDKFKKNLSPLNRQ